MGDGVLPVRTQHSALMWLSLLCVAAPLENGMDAPMRGLVLGSGHVGSVLLLSVLVVSTCLSQAQGITSRNQSSFQLPDAPSAVAGVSDGSKDLHIFDKRSTLHLLRDGNHSSWWISSSWNPVVSARARGLTFVPNYGHVQLPATHSVDDWQYYGHRIPVAGSVAMRVAQEAQAHPRVASLFKIIQPQFRDSGIASQMKGRGQAAALNAHGRRSFGR
jgi:hypothetical protein